MATTFVQASGHNDHSFTCSRVSELVREQKKSPLSTRLRSAQAKQVSLPHNTGESRQLVFSRFLVTVNYFSKQTNIGCCALYLLLDLNVALALTVAATVALAVVEAGKCERRKTIL